MALLLYSQKDIVVDYVLGNDVFAVLPISFEKVCCACLPWVFDQPLETNSSVVVVVSPLTVVSPRTMPFSLVM